MIIRGAFTGTRADMTPRQASTVQRVYEKNIGLTHLYHGGCHGADRTAHRLMLDTDVEEFNIYPSNVEQVEWAQLEVDRTVREYHKAVFIHNIDAPLRRNRRMVDATVVLVAAPRTLSYDEERRSGTWATIRYARHLGKPIYIVWPNGTYKTENV